jgi:large subunit ribosomal protein L29
VTKRTIDVQHLNELDDYGLGEALRERRQELLQLRLQRATGQLEQHRRIREIRRGFALIHTILRIRDLAQASEGPG